MAGKVVVKKKRKVNKAPLLGVAPPKRQGPSIFKIGCTMVWVVVGLFIAFWIFVVVKTNMDPEYQASLNEPGVKQLDAAEKLILSNRKGSAHGNTGEAIGIARTFAELMRKQREILFTGTDEATLLSASDGEFITYCQIHEEAAIFLVHVPNLRKYTSEAQDAMVDLAWDTANTVLTTAVEEPPAALCRRQGSHLLP